MAEGSLRASAPGSFSSLRLASGVVNFGDTTVTIDSLAAGEVVVNTWVQVRTAFNAGTTNVLIVGKTGATNAYIDANGVTEGTPGVYPTGGAGPFAAEAAAKDLIATYTQTGDAAETGAATVYALIASVAE